VGGVGGGGEEEVMGGGGGGEEGVVRGGWEFVWLWEIRLVEEDLAAS
jgi:hypothetical protein